MSPDPLDSSAGVPYEHLAELRATCPVTQTASGAFYLARCVDVLAATKNLEAFPASCREPGVVVPPEELLISTACPVLSTSRGGRARLRR